MFIIIKLGPCSNRHYGIVLAITFWQLINEIATFLAIIIAMFFIVGNNRFTDKLLLLCFVCQVFVVKPSFYLFADSRFRMEVIDYGIGRALINALKQD